MGHSAEYQTELYIRQLDQMSQTLFDESEKFRKDGLDELADATLDKSEQLRHAIAHLRKVIEE